MAYAESSRNVEQGQPTSLSRHDRQCSIILLGKTEQEAMDKQN